MSHAGIPPSFRRRPGDGYPDADVNGYAFGTFAPTPDPAVDPDRLACYTAASTALAAAYGDRKAMADTVEPRDILGLAIWLSGDDEAPEEADAPEEVEAPTFADTPHLVSSERTGFDRVRPTEFGLGFSPTEVRA